MKLRMVIALCGLATAVAGCCSSRPGYAPAGDQSLEQRNLANLYMVESPFSEAVANGIIAQHTIYPYHFTNGTAQLTELGKRDLRVLANHYKTSSGQLSIRRAGASKELYAARVQAVMNFLGDDGVDVKQVTVSNALPGGDGMESERVLSVLTEGKKEGATYKPGAGAAGKETGVQQ